MKKHRENQLIIFSTKSFSTTKFKEKNFFSGCFWPHRGHKAFSATRRTLRSVPFASEKRDFLVDLWESQRAQVKNLIKNFLQNYWEIFLSTYQSSKKKLYFGTTPMSFGFSKNLKGRVAGDHDCLLSERIHQQREDTNFFYLKKETIFSSNFFILAKIVNLIGDTKIVQKIVRQLIKIQSKHLELEKLIKIKTFQNGFFFTWICYLLMEQFYQFIKNSSVFLYRAQFVSPFGSLWRNRNKIENHTYDRRPISQISPCFIFKCKDFLILKWYKNNIHKWIYQILDKNKKTNLNQNSKKSSAPNVIRSILGKIDKPIFYPQAETNSSHQNIIREKCVDVNYLLSYGLKQRYLKLIKKLVQKKKVTTQVELIQRLNKILSNWDTFVINNISKKNSLKLNLILYQLLWRWGFARHRKKKAKWIQNRYWLRC